MHKQRLKGPQGSCYCSCMLGTFFDSNKCKCKRESGTIVGLVFWSILVYGLSSSAVVLACPCKDHEDKKGQANHTELCPN